MKFQGFTQEASDFFWDLTFNNERSWFAAHKEQYERCFNTPFKALATDTFDLLMSLYGMNEPELHVSRIYRDARRLFGRGPFKENMWFSIYNHSAHEESPSFFFEITPSVYRYGMGFWAPKASMMENFRKSIDEFPDRFETLAKDVTAMPEFTMWGEKYKKPRGNISPVVNEWYNRKWFSIVSEHDFGGDLLTPDMPHILADAFLKLVPMFEYLETVTRDSDMTVVDMDRSTETGIKL